MAVGIRIEHAVARAVARSDGSRDACARALQAIGEGLHWPLAAAWEPTVTEPNELRCIAIWAAAHDGAHAFAQTTRATVLRSGEGLPGRVWQTGQAAWVVDAAADVGMPRRAAAGAAGLRAALCFPVCSERGVVGVVEVFGVTPLEPDAELLATFESVGAQLGQVFERRRVEKSHQASELRYRATLQAALDCVVTMDHTGRVVEFNPAAERTFGYTGEEAVGREMAELIVPPALREQHRRGLARYLAEGTPRVLDRRVEIEAMRADGSRFPVELTITRVGIPGPPVFTAYLRDISERRRGEAELKASRGRIVEAGDDARRRIERDLHDGAQQHLVGLALTLRLARSRLREDVEVAEQLLDEAIDDLATATASLRELARGIHPAVLTEGGLEPALTVLSARVPVPITITGVPSMRLPHPIEATAYFVVAEALTNVARYAGASRAHVSLALDDGRLVVKVRDDGRGGATEEGGTGLRGLADRVAALDGRFSVESPIGGGTTVRAELPCRS
jgi:PAS domain S-box-containing protein